MVAELSFGADRKMIVVPEAKCTKSPGERLGSAREAPGKRPLLVGSAPFSVISHHRNQSVWRLHFRVEVTFL